MLTNVRDSDLCSDLTMSISSCETYIDCDSSRNQLSNFDSWTLPPELTLLQILKACTSSEIKSAGLSSLLTWLQQSDGRIDWISALRLDTNVFWRDGSPDIHARTIVESLHAYTPSNSTFNASRTFFNSLTRTTTAPHSSSLGRVIFNVLIMFYFLLTRLAIWNKVRQNEVCPWRWFANKCTLRMLSMKRHKMHANRIESRQNLRQSYAESELSLCPPNPPRMCPTPAEAQPLTDHPNSNLPPMFPAWLSLLESKLLIPTDRKV